MWGGLFSTFDCAVKGVRKKEDPWNAIIAGFFTGGSLAVRGGYKQIRNGAIGCAVLLAVIEGVGMGFQRMLAGSQKLEVRCYRRLETTKLTVNLYSSHRHLQTTKRCWLRRLVYDCWFRDTSRPERLTVHIPTLLPRPRRWACISVCIHDGQHSGGGVPCNIDMGWLRLPRGVAGRGAQQRRQLSIITLFNMFLVMGKSRDHGRSHCFSDLDQAGSTLATSSRHIRTTALPLSSTQALNIPPQL